MSPIAIANTIDAAARDLVKAEVTSFFTQLVSGTPMDEAAERAVKGLELIKAAHERFSAEAAKVFA